MKDCIFCKFSGDLSQIEGRVLYRDSRCIAFLVNRPESKGHFVVIPTRHYSNVEDMGPKFFRLIEKAIELSKLLKKIGADAFTIKVNNNLYKLSGSKGHVGHVHVHIIPVTKIDGKKIPPKEASADKLKAVREALLAS